MAKVISGFRTTKGKTWLKKQDSAGRTYYIEKGEGRTTAEAYAGASSHFEYAYSPELEKDELPKDFAEAGLDKLQRMTGIDFTVRRSRSIKGPEAESTRARKRAEANRFYAFWKANERRYDDREEAAKDYLRFRREIAEAPTKEVRAIVRESYNLGGS